MRSALFSAALSFTMVLALGVFIRTVIDTPGGLIGSNAGLIGIAAGLAAGTLLGEFLRRRYSS